MGRRRRTRSTWWTRRQAAWPGTLASSEATPLSTSKSTHVRCAVTPPPFSHALPRTFVENRQNLTTPQLRPAPTPFIALDALHLPSMCILNTCRCAVVVECGCHVHVCILCLRLGCSPDERTTGRCAPTAGPLRARLGSSQRCGTALSQTHVGSGRATCQLHSTLPIFVTWCLSCCFL